VQEKLWDLQRENPAAKALPIAVSPPKTNVSAD
jgi:hypothetical protein